MGLVVGVAEGAISTLLIGAVIRPMEVVIGLGEGAVLQALELAGIVYMDRIEVRRRKQNKSKSK